MNAEALSRSLSYLPDSMIGEAIAARVKARIYQKTWFRAAACIAVVLGLLFGISFPWLTGEKYITAPSILAVKAYAFENGQPKEYELKEGVTTYDHGWMQDHSFGLSCVPGFPITFSFSYDQEKYQDLVLDISVNKGHFMDWSYDIDANGNFHRREDRGIKSKQISSFINRTIYWRYWEIDPETGEVTSYGENGARDIYIDVIARDGSNVVGYAVLNLVNSEWDQYKMYLLESVYYPKILGRYQGVSEEYVQLQMETVKQNRT